MPGIQCYGRGRCTCKLYFSTKALLTKFPELAPVSKRIITLPAICSKFWAVLIDMIGKIRFDEVKDKSSGVYMVTVLYWTYAPKGIRTSILKWVFHPVNFYDYLISLFILGLSNIGYCNQLANATHFNMTEPQDLQAAYALVSNY